MKVILDINKEQLEDLVIILKAISMEDYNYSLEMRNTLGIVRNQIQKQYQDTLLFKDEFK